MMTCTLLENGYLRPQALIDACSPHAGSDMDHGCTVSDIRVGMQRKLLADGQKVRPFNITTNGISGDLRGSIRAMNFEGPPEAREIFRHTDASPLV